MPRPKGSPVRLLAWGKRCVVTDDRERLDRMRFELHVTGLSSPTVLGTWTVDRLELGQDWAEEVIGAAQEHADNMGSAQVFSVVLLEDEGGGELRQVSSYAVKRYPEEYDTEHTADAAGIVAQSLRHNEALLRSTIAGHQATVGSLAKVLDRMDRRMAAMEAREVEAMSVYREALIALADVEAMRKADPDEERKTRAMGKLEGILADVVRGHLGLGAGAPAPSDPAGALKGAFLAAMERHNGDVRAVLAELGITAEDARRLLGAGGGG